MNKDDFFKQVLKQFFYEFAKTPSTISWDDDYKVTTIRIKLHKHDCYVRIYDTYYIMMSSTNKGPYKSDDFNLDTFKQQYQFMSDGIPF